MSCAATIEGTNNVSASTLRPDKIGTAEDGQFQADFPGARYALRISPTLFQPGVFVAGDAGAGNFFESFSPVGRELRPGGAEVLSDLVKGVDSTCADVNQFVLQHEGDQVTGQAGVSAFEIAIF